MGRSIRRLATPVLIEQFLLYLVGFSDTLLAGLYLHSEELAAVTVAGYLLWFLTSLSTVVAAGATAIVARRIGAGDWREASRVTRLAVGLAVMLGLLMLFVTWFEAPRIVGWLQLKGRSAEEAATYLRIVMLSAPLIFAEQAGNACLRGAGDTRTGMWAIVLINVLNVPLSWAFVTGRNPWGPLGLAGIAVGTAIGQAAGGAMVLAALWSGRAGLRPKSLTGWPSWSEYWPIFRISLPATGESLTLVLCQLWFLALINRLGPTATAAHGVAIRCEALGFLSITAFAVTAGTLAGQALGAGDPRRARRAVGASLRWGLLILSLLGGFLAAYAEPMFRLFLGGGTNQPGVLEMGVPVLRLVAFAMPALAVINVLSGALRGAGETRWPWLFIVIGFLGVRLPLTAWLTSSAPGGLELGLMGAWIAMFVDLHIRAGMVLVLYRRGGWARREV